MVGMMSGGFQHQLYGDIQENDIKKLSIKILLVTLIFYKIYFLQN